MKRSLEITMIFLYPLIILLIVLYLALNMAKADPNIASFETNMRTYGQTLCGKLATYSGDDQWGQPNGLNDTYYDGQRVFYNLRDYTNDLTWLPCAERAEAIYRDRYVNGAGSGKCNGGFCAGYWIFTRGLLESFQRTGDTVSKQAVINLSKNASFCRDTTAEDPTDPQYMREIAYCVNAFLDAEKVGEPRRVRLSTYVNALHSQLNQIFITNSYTGLVQPFWVALASEALIHYAEDVGDPRVVPLLDKVGKELYSRFWLTTDLSFKMNTNDPSGTKDLNLLIAPLYAYVFDQTLQTWFRDKFDEIFNSGVAYGYFASGKQFNQNYRWSIDGLLWRARALPTPTPIPTATSTATPTPKPTIAPTVTPTIHPCEKAPASTSPFSGASCTNYFLKQIRDK